MRMVVAYIRETDFEPIRAELQRLGSPSLSIAAVDCSGRGEDITLHYRGATLTNHLRPRVKLECVVEAADVATVVDVVLAHTSTCSEGDDRVFVLAVEAHPVDTVAAFDQIVADDRLALGRI